MDSLLWVRIGDAGEYISFDNLDDAIDYLNELRVGQATGWTQAGFETPNYHGQDYVSIYWGDNDTNHLADLDDDEQEHIESGLEENSL